MELAELERRIEQVHASPHPSVLRLDDKGELRSRVAALPSAYNPPTRAHLELLRAAVTVEGVGSAVALLTTRNVAKNLYGASLAHRAAMLLVIGADDGKLPVFVTNQARIADQARVLATTLQDPGVDMIVGYDTLVRVFDEQYYGAMQEELATFFADHRLIAANRAGHGSREIAEVVARPEARPFGGRILEAEIGDEAAALSSTAARAAIATGREPSEIPPEVRAYIARHGLYAHT
jgi:nicotinamide-nucleotide adenylyltransferase